MSNLDTLRKKRRIIIERLERLKRFIETFNEMNPDKRFQLASRKMKLLEDRKNFELVQTEIEISIPTYMNNNLDQEIQLRFKFEDECFLYEAKLDQLLQRSFISNREPSSRGSSRENSSEKTNFGHLSRGFSQTLLSNSDPLNFDWWVVKNLWICWR